jgi:hypothetical protein
MKADARLAKALQIKRKGLKRERKMAWSLMDLQISERK